VRRTALAFAAQFRQRHRWGLLGVVGYLAALGVYNRLIRAPGPPVHLDNPEAVAGVVVIPLATTFIYLLAVFTFGLAGDLAARESIFPARMFTLPVRTAELVAWPMLFGTVAVSVLWLGTALFGLRPRGIEIGLVWPAAAGAAILAWTQAFVWMPYGLRGLRVIVAVLCLSALDAIVFTALTFKVPEPVLVAALLPQLPLAYAVACVAVARARRGDVPDWRPALARPGAVAAPSRRRDERFASPEHAQRWFEWRQHGRALPALVAVLLPFELAMLWLAGDTPVLVIELLLLVLCTPPFMAAFAAATVGRADTAAPGTSGLAPFTATRPMRGAALIGAKLRMTIVSTLVAWLLVLVATPLALTLSGTWPAVMDRAADTVSIFGAPRAAVLLLLLLAMCVATTWRQLVQNLYVGLTGREWLMKGSAFLALTLLAVLWPVAIWTGNHGGVLAALWNDIAAILAALGLLKLLGASWVAVRLHRSGLLSDRTLVLGAAAWVGVVFALYGLLGWLLSGPLVPRHYLVLIAILAVPLTRLSAAPLALSWNRHR